MIAAGLNLGLEEGEVETVRRRLGREPNEIEWAIIDAEWSEHSSYKSSKKLLRLFPTKGKRVLLGPGYDAGVVDVGDGYFATLHIESHNHPSAVDPYGGASTGIGGVLRDILSVGSRPIALLDILRFGNIEKSGHSRWLLRNVVRGISDYGNCVGVPTVAGDMEFDGSFEKNCLVDVACVGIGRRGSLILGEAKRPGDVLVVVGGSSGRDGVGGATFASKNLSKGSDSERTSVQVPDPFMKKLLLDSLLEAAETRLIRGMKDLGGGGLSTALSEIASKGGTGVDVELGTVRLREPGMAPAEIMTSESQERMLLILGQSGAGRILRILDRYEVPHAVIGRVTGDGMLRIRWKGEVVANLPAKLVAEAPLARRTSKKPAYLKHRPTPAGREPEIGKSILSLLSSPSISSKRWVFEQYDHEVGVRTVVRPGEADAALLRLPNGSMLAVKADGNSKHAFLDPHRGAAGCVAEACRNVVAVGAEPMAMVDHLQFGDPSDEEVYWTFKEAVLGMAEYCRAARLPVVGGKVSFYNEDATTKRAIKPSPIAMVAGLARPGTRHPAASFGKEGETVLAVGKTRRELGGSEYHETVLRSSGGVVPRADGAADGRLHGVLLELIRRGAVSAVHDCSKGGLAVALAEMCVPRGVGAAIDVAEVPSDSMTAAETLFSESHGRFLLSAVNGAEVEGMLKRSRIPHALIGRTGGKALRLMAEGRPLASLAVEDLRESWEGALPELMT